MLTCLVCNSHTNQTVGVVVEIQAQDGGRIRRRTTKGKGDKEDHIAHEVFLCSQIRAG